MTLFERVQMPSFAGATGWLNSEPLGAAELWATSSSSTLMSASSQEALHAGDVSL